MASFDTLLQVLEEGVLPTPFADIPVRFSILCREKKLPSYDACLQLALEKPAEIDFVLHTKDESSNPGFRQIKPGSLDTSGRCG